MDRAVLGRKHSFLVVLGSSKVLKVIAESNGIRIRREMAMLPLIGGLGVIVEEG